MVVRSSIVEDGGIPVPVSVTFASSVEGSQNVKEELFEPLAPSHVIPQEENAAPITLTNDNGATPTTPIVLNKAAEEVREFLVETVGSTLKAWINYFDTDNDQTVTLHEFIIGMRELQYPGDTVGLYKRLDEDGSNSLSMADVDPEQAELWRRFRIWCVTHFNVAEDVMLVLNRLGASALGIHIREDRPLTLPIFTEGIIQGGWTYGSADILFDAMDDDNSGTLDIGKLSWLDIEVTRQQRKADAKEKATQTQLSWNRRQHSNRDQKERGEQSLKVFKNWLRKRYGGYIRAWRNGLSPYGSMFLNRAQFFKACAKIGWMNDVGPLWKALDKDESGCISMDELDLKSAETLARFFNFIDSNFGGSAAAFKAIDRQKQKKIRQPEFERELAAFGYDQPLKVLFNGLDRHGKKFIVEEDMLFLDKWKPLPFLLAPPNPQAMEEVKELLLKTCKTYLKAWRRYLDKNCTNRCNWDEFLSACKRLSYSGDIPGAWRAIDADLSGYITLQELDPASSLYLLNFRKWADQEFGGVRSAFGVFDGDGSGDISCTEFRRSCRIYGFGGDTLGLFRALDTEKTGSLTFSDVAFLDDWDVSGLNGEESDAMTADDLEELDSVCTGRQSTFDVDTRLSTSKMEPIDIAVVEEKEWEEDDADEDKDLRDLTLPNHDMFTDEFRLPAWRPVPVRPQRLLPCTNEADPPQLHSSLPSAGAIYAAVSARCSASVRTLPASANVHVSGNPCARGDSLRAALSLRQCSNYDRSVIAPFLERRPFTVPRHRLRPPACTQDSFRPVTRNINTIVRRPFSSDSTRIPASDYDDEFVSPSLPFMPPLASPERQELDCVKEEEVVGRTEDERMPQIVGKRRSYNYAASTARGDSKALATSDARSHSKSRGAHGACDGSGRIDARDTAGGVFTDSDVHQHIGHLRKTSIALDVDDDRVGFDGGKSGIDRRVVSGVGTRLAIVPALVGRLNDGAGSGVRGRTVCMPTLDQLLLMPRCGPSDHGKRRSRSTTSSSAYQNLPHRLVGNSGSQVMPRTAR
eukprot:TRINITY_DN35053_c0_g1_i1.p1 TRINITY_DN35053_c0_g1~~TRINITY_DN35053_c0_g1_i1.p1  ORF type:complete len:1032 (+),score=169.03 TRINITY_DN35053_c0_g1_i1:381-3476(+)